MEYARTVRVTLIAFVFTVSAVLKIRDIRGFGGRPSAGRRPEAWQTCSATRRCSSSRVSASSGRRSFRRRALALAAMAGLAGTVPSAASDDIVDLFGRNP